MRHIAATVCSAAMVIFFVAFFAGVAENSARSVATAMGSTGETLRVVASVDNGKKSFIGSDKFTEAVSAFAAENSVSVAFSPSDAGNIVTLLDTSGRFSFGNRSVEDALRSSSAAAGAVSTALPLESRSRLIPGDATVVGEFPPTTTFDYFYPAVLLNTAAAPFTSGVYLIAGATPAQLPSVAALFESSGMELLHLSAQKPTTIGSTLQGIYGGVLSGFACVILIAALLIAHIQATFSRQRLGVAAALGANSWQRRWLVARRIWPSVGAGLFAGISVCAGVLAIMRGTMLLSTLAAGTSIAAGTLIASALWCIIIAWVSHWESRRCKLALPC